MTARMLRNKVAVQPRVQAVLVEELVQGVLTSARVQLAAAVLRASHPDARLALAVRLCDVVDTLAPEAPGGGRGSDCNVEDGAAQQVARDLPGG